MPNPLHPAIVHFPLVLAVLLPFAAAAAFVVSRRAGARGGAWIGLTVMTLILTGSAWLSVETGQDQEDRVERVVPEGAIHTHEEAAEGLLLGSILVSAVILLGLLPGRVGRGARWLAAPGGLVVLALALRVGDSGGALVYEHGAASAYVASAGTAGSAGSAALPASGRRDRDDDDEGRERH